MCDDTEPTTRPLTQNAHHIHGGLHWIGDISFVPRSDLACVVCGRRNLCEVEFMMFESPGAPMATESVCPPCTDWYREETGRNYVYP